MFFFIYPPADPSMQYRHYFFTQNVTDGRSDKKPAREGAHDSMGTPTADETPLVQNENETSKER